MKKKDLLELQVPESCHEAAVQAIKAASRAGRFFKFKRPHEVLKEIVGNPSGFQDDAEFGTFAKFLITEQARQEKEQEEYAKNPYASNITFRQWGDNIDPNAIDQMKMACSIPVAVAGANMADSHLGYGLPIGGVLGTYESVIPYGVGVDISCSMKLSILDYPVKNFKDVFSHKTDECANALENGTKFGVGGSWNPRLNHPVMDQDWNITSITKELKDKAWSQMGTSGSGNHFAEFGILQFDKDADVEGVLIPAGQYVALMSHSGSRGAGAAICNKYSEIAKFKLPKAYKQFENLAWLSMASEAGQEYWLAMNLMHDYAKANHELIHKNVSELCGAKVLATVFNSHNLAWKETHDGKEIFVHRKGATPANVGQFGIIPGSMADPAFLVVGRGNSESLRSASHGAGRQMSRRQATRTFNWHEWKSVLKQRGVRLLSAGLDEVPGAYKRIEEVMAAQTDLVDVVARFDPKIVKMSDDNTSED